MENANIAGYVVKRRDDGWEFVPSSTFVSLMVLGFGASAAFFVWLSTFFFQSANPWLTASPILAAGLCAAIATRAWRTRSIPLNIGNGGRVSYGEQELCAAGTVRSVRIVPSHGGEVGDCEVRLELADGSQVAIPSQYFAGYKSRKHARPFAAEFAKVLRVQVTESG